MNADDEAHRRSQVNPGWDRDEKPSAAAPIGRHSAPPQTMRPSPGVPDARFARMRRFGPPAAAAAVLLCCLVVGALGFALAHAPAGGGAAAGGPAGSGDAVREPRADAKAPADPGDIVIGVNGDENTYVLKGEEYLEAGAHAAEPTDGTLNAKITTTGSVDTSTPGDYAVSYRVVDSQGHEAGIKRIVHVVETMETQGDGVPILMYHYVYSASNPPEQLNANYLLDTVLEEQLRYLSENHFYFPSYPEVQAFIQGRHSLPKKSVVLGFDDGEAGFLNIGIPLLEKYKISATSFIIASDGDAAQKVIEHRSRYISFQSHSFDMHRAGGTIGHGGRISALTKDQIVEDLTRAQQILGTTEALAYPFGDVTDDARGAVAQAHILCAFTTKNEWASKGADTAALPRVRIAATTSIASFRYLVNET